MQEQICRLCKHPLKTPNRDIELLITVVCETCGTYRTSRPLATKELEDIAGKQEYVLSGITRQASDAGNPITIKSEEDVSALLESVVIPRNPLEQMDRTLLNVSTRQRKADEHVQLFFDKDYPLGFAKDGDEFRFLLEALVDRNLLERRGALAAASADQFYRLTPDGWERVEQLRKTQPDSNQAFVAMWFDDKLRSAWDEGFKPALESTGFDPIRVDQLQYNDKIDDRIIAEIRRSGLLVADFTDHRGGVYFEAGFAMGLGIPVIWTCRDTDIGQAHFDTRQYNHIVWTNPKELREKLTYRIAATIPGREVHR